MKSETKRLLNDALFFLLFLIGMLLAGHQLNRPPDVMARCFVPDEGFLFGLRDCDISYEQPRSEAPVTVAMRGPALENNEHKMEVCTEKERQPPHCWNVPIAFETAQHGTFMRSHDALDAVGIPNGQLWRD
jgi:hypothetical protein